MTRLRIKESFISVIEVYYEHYEQSINEFYFIYIMIITLKTYSIYKCIITTR